MWGQFEYFSEGKKRFKQLQKKNDANQLLKRQTGSQLL